MLVLLSSKPSTVKRRNYLNHAGGTQILGETCFQKIVLVDLQGYYLTTSIPTSF